MIVPQLERSENMRLPEDFEENPPMGFVYRIENKETGKFYIGFLHKSFP